MNLESVGTINTQEQYGVVSSFIPENITKEDLPTFLSEKRAELRDKYKVPDRTGVSKGLETPSDYCHKLFIQAESEGFDVVTDFENYAVEHDLPEGSGACFAEDTDNKIHLKRGFNPNNVPEVKELEHELVHALQYKVYPDMPIEQKEFEAYIVADGLDEIFKKENLRDQLFSLINNSVAVYNQINNSNEK